MLITGVEHSKTTITYRLAGYQLYTAQKRQAAGAKLETQRGKEYRTYRYGSQLSVKAFFENDV